MYKKNIYITTMIFLLFWLKFSNVVIMKTGESAPVQEIMFREDWSNRTVSYSLDVTERKNLTEDITLIGWAFIETEEDNSERYTSCMLRGENCCYEMRFEPPQDKDKSIDIFTRPDVRITFPNKKIPPAHWEYEVIFSTIPVKDGIYRLYIYCYENEITYGIADTGIWLKKSGSSITKYNWLSERCEEIKTTEDSLCRSSIGLAEVKSNNIEIQGWAFAEGLASSQQMVFISLVDDTVGTNAIYTTVSKTRLDVGEVFADDLYNESGFYAKIPKDELPDGTYTLHILVENDGKVWDSQSVGLSKSNGTLVLEK